MGKVLKNSQHDSYEHITSYEVFSAFGQANYYKVPN